MSSSEKVQVLVLELALKVLSRQDLEVESMVQRMKEFDKLLRITDMTLKRM